MNLAKAFGLFLVGLAIFVFSFYTICLIGYPFFPEFVQGYLLNPTQITYLMGTLLAMAGGVVLLMLILSVAKSKKKK
ncbi:unnamed protein product [Moneuplotes crassus]|uniref:Dolichol phosphate-mannose biosynthesis regulatory protein n=1 Tax=Euplotes crassus TaxID=5936 RepID=A0AAD1Y7F1_EUPCR|nr:unnamed protein product [Moneuplotes crassus]